MQNELKVKSYHCYPLVHIIFNQHMCQVHGGDGQCTNTKESEYDVNGNIRDCLRHTHSTATDIRNCRYEYLKWRRRRRVS